MVIPSQALRSPPRAEARPALRIWQLFFVAAVVSLAQIKTEEKRFVGAASCGACHPAQFARQSESGHARSLRPVAEHPLAKSFLPENPLTRKPNFRFEFSRDYKVRVSDGKETVEFPIQWAFGAGDQAVTFVSQVDEDWYVEHHFSFYAAIGGLEATPGHQGVLPGEARGAVGVLYRTFDPEPKIMACFQCHSTGRLRLGPKMEIQPGEFGVRCEACHGAGSLHARAAQRGETARLRKLIDNPRRLSASDLNQFCGQCHRKPAPAGGATDWNDPWNARHQPLYLSQSACFQKSKGSLSCLSCHDPHGRLRRGDASYYDSRCKTCHAGKGHPQVANAEMGKLDNCAACHMPAVEPLAHLRFANHWIGVYRDGASLRPSR